MKAQKVKPMVRLTQKQIKDKLAFKRHYIASANAAQGSLVDANANVASKNIATLQGEMFKDFSIQMNRFELHDTIASEYGIEFADLYVQAIEGHTWYKHDETNMSPYCTAVTLFPFLLNGTRQLGGSSGAPRNLDSFCGQFINVLYLISSQFAGAVATVEFLLYFDHFARLEYGDNYMETHDKEVCRKLAQVVYSVNEPSAARGYQAVFWNAAILDRPYLESLFEGFRFPHTWDTPDFDSTSKLQVFFMEWLNKERETALLTFPIMTACSIYDKETGEAADVPFQDFLCDQMSKGNSFFNYQSDSVDSLSSCCRLRNELDTAMIEFSSSLGAGGVATGSVSVMTLNMNRLEQDDHRTLEGELELAYMWQAAYRKIVQGLIDDGMLPVYDAGYISLNKQFSTIGLSGMAEAAEFRGITVGNNTEYKKFCSDKLEVIYKMNREASKKYGFKINTEFVPAEGLGVKFAKWDREDGYVVNRDCYNSYFYLVEDQSLDIFDKFEMHGEQVTKWLDGGSAYHCNLDDFPTAEGYRSMFKAAAINGCNYWTTNIPSTCCNKCGYIGKKFLNHCAVCGSTDVDHATRVIGYLKKITNFSKARQEEANRRAYGDARQSVVIDVQTMRPYSSQPLPTTGDELCHTLTLDEMPKHSQMLAPEHLARTLVTT